MSGWIATIVIGLVGSLFAFNNWYLLFLKAQAARQDRENRSSFSPLTGGILGMVAIYNAPIAVDPWWYLAPLVLDFGCLPYFAFGAVAAWRERGKPSA